jgi:hypothetical protein
MTQVGHVRTSADSIGVAAPHGHAASTSQPARARFFVGYEVTVQAGRVAVCERQRVQDETSGETSDAELPGRLPLGGALLRGMAEDEALRAAVTARLTALRREIERRGVKFMVDRTRDGRLVFKWKYQLGGKWQTETVEAVGLPPEIQSIVTDDYLHGRPYWHHPAYRRWFGRSKAAKQGEVIAAVVRGEFSR